MSTNILLSHRVFIVSVVVSRLDVLRICQSQRASMPVCMSKLKLADMRRRPTYLYFIHVYGREVRHELRITRRHPSSIHWLTASIANG